MDSTDTQTRLETLERDLESNRPSIPIGRALAALAAAAAVIATLVLVDARGDDRTSSPANPVDTQAAEQVATDFITALAAYDAERAASYLADDARIQLKTTSIDAETLDDQVRWTRAVGFRLIPGRCDIATVPTPDAASPAAASSVACVYDAEGLGSERLGRGPFRDNVLRLTIVRGEIVSAVEEWGSDDFEVIMWEPFVAWLVSTRADEAAFMFADSPWAMRPALSARSASLWEANVDRYVRAVERGDAY